MDKCHLFFHHRFIMVSIWIIAMNFAVFTLACENNLRDV